MFNSLFARALVFIVSLFLSFWGGYFFKKCHCNVEPVVIVEKKVDTVYVEKGMIIETLKYNPGCKPIIDTIQKDSIVIDTVYEVSLRKYVFEDSLLRASLWANYVDTSSFRYSLKKPLITTTPHETRPNLISTGITRDGTLLFIDYSRLFLNNRISIGIGWIPAEKRLYLRAGVAF